MEANNKIHSNSSKFKMDSTKSNLNQEDLTDWVQKCVGLGKRSSHSSTQNCDLNQKCSYSGLLEKERKLNQVKSVLEVKDHQQTLDDIYGNNSWKLTEKMEHQLKMDYSTLKAAVKKNLKGAEKVNKSRSMVLQQQNAQQSAQNNIPTRSKPKKSISTRSCIGSRNDDEYKRNVEASKASVQCQSGLEGYKCTKCDEVFSKRGQLEKHFFDTHLATAFAQVYGEEKSGKKIHTKKHDEKTHHVRIPLTEAALSTNADQGSKDSKQLKKLGQVLNCFPCTSSNPNKINPTKVRQDDNNLEMFKKVMKTTQCSHPKDVTTMLATNPWDEESKKMLKESFRSAQRKTSHLNTISSTASKIIHNLKEKKSLNMFGEALNTTQNSRSHHKTENSVELTKKTTQAAETDSNLEKSQKVLNDLNFPRPGSYVKKELEQNFSKASDFRKKIENRQEESKKCDKSHEREQNKYLKPPVVTEFSEKCHKNLNYFLNADILPPQFSASSQKPYPCQKCNLSFSKASHLEKHMQKFHVTMSAAIVTSQENITKIPCEEAIKKHAQKLVKNSINSKTFQRCNSELIFPNQSTLNPSKDPTATKSSMSSKIFHRCDNELRFPNQPTLNPAKDPTATKNSMNSKTFRRSDSELRFPNQPTLNPPSELRFPNQPTWDPTKDIPATKSYFCIKCERVFSDLKKLQKHIKKAHFTPPGDRQQGLKNLPSELPDEKKEQSKALVSRNCVDENDSSSKRQMDSNTTRDVVLEYPCEICDRLYSTASLLIKHIEDVHLAEISNRTIRTSCKRLARARENDEKQISSLKEKFTEAMQTIQK